MTPAARVSAAIEILDAFAASDVEMADKILARWARAHRFAGSKDRAAIADRVYDALRRWRSYGARFGETGRGRALGSLAAEGRSLDAIEALFDGGRFAPAPLSAGEREALGEAAAAVAAPLDWPDWLSPELDRSVADAPAEIRMLSQRAAVDLRANAAKADRDAVARRLRDEATAARLEVSVAPGPISPVALRLDRAAPVHRLALFADGWIEPQDAASQAVASIAAAALPDGATILDYCAGGGGKTLAMAAAAPTARLCAFDVAPGRMADLPARAARAGAAPEIVGRRALGDLREACDVVLVDAPCSGAGAWARNPDAKWRLTPEGLARRQSDQRTALRAASAYVRPGGRLVYVTCSLLRCENDDVARAFLVDDPRFAPAPVGPLWRSADLRGAPPDGHDATFTPATTSTDGFYLAAFERRDPPR